MPNPLDYLKKAGNWAMTPLVDEETIEPYQDAIDSPSLDRSEGMAQLQGFGAGALEGLRGLTSPMDLAGFAAGGAGGALRGMRGAKTAMQAAPTLDLIEPSVVKQVAPAMDDVDALIGDMKRNLAKIPGRGQPAQAAAQMAPEARQAAPEGSSLGSLYRAFMNRGMGGAQ